MKPAHLPKPKYAAEIAPAQEQPQAKAAVVAKLAALAAPKGAPRG